MDIQAFQFDAFQSGAFQSEVLTEWAFQQCAFQADAFQADFCQQPEPDVVVIPSGGKVTRERKEEKKELPTFHPWIHFPKVAEPEVSKKVIEVVQETFKESSPDLRLAKSEKALKSWLDQQELVWLDQYARLLELEIERKLQEQQEADIAFVLALLVSE